MKARILITGGSGFIGTNLINFYRNRAELLNIDIAAPRDVSQSALWVKCDILDYEKLAKLVCEFGPTFLIHMAARTDLDEKIDLGGYRANIEGVQNVVEATKAAKSVQRAIFASSMLVCEVGYKPKGYDDYKPTTLYGESKVLGEKVVKESRDLDAEWTIVRPTSIWGPWFGTPYRDFFDVVIKKRFLHPGKRACSKTYGYIGNTVDQIDRLLKAPGSSVNRKTFYLGDVPPINISDWANEIAAELGYRPPHYVPFVLFRLAAVLGDLLGRVNIAFPMTSFRLRNMTTDNVLELNDLIDIVGDARVSRREGVQRTLEWMKAYRV